MPDADLGLLLDVVQEAGTLALSFNRDRMRVRSKPDGTVVTEVDLAVDKLLRSRITTARPHDGWLSEETPDTIARLSRTRLWIADPIDGTRSFATGSGPWGIGMALIENGLPSVAAILRPADRMLFHAVRGRGSFLNGTAIACKDSATVRDQRVIAPRKLGRLLDEKSARTESHSPLPLLLRMASIAAGDHLAAISQGEKNDWDIAAGHLIVTEAGGRVSTLAGGEVIYNQLNPWQPGLIAAAGPQSHAAIYEIVRQA